MTLIKDIINFTETFAPLSTAVDYDNVGLLVGNEASAVSKVLLALDITKDVIYETHDLKAQLIISHHPIIFTPLKRLEYDSVPYMLAQHSINALCLHTNLDIAADTGVNMCLAHALELENIKHYDGEFLASGTLSSPLSAETFAQLVKKKLKSELVSCTLKNKTVQNIFMCSGAVGNEFERAVSLGADAFVTGEARHHNYLESIHSNVSLITAGHFETEDVVIAPLRDKLKNKFPHIEFIKSTALSSPLSYV